MTIHTTLSIINCILYFICGFIWGYYTVPALKKNRTLKKQTPEINSHKIINDSKKIILDNTKILEADIGLLKKIVSDGWHGQSTPEYIGCDKCFYFIKGNYKLFLVQDLEGANLLSGYGWFADKYGLLYFFNNIHNYDYEAELNKLDKEYERAHSGYNSLGAYKLNSKKRRLRHVR